MPQQQRMITISGEPRADIDVSAMARVIVRFARELQQRQPQTPTHAATAASGEVAR